LNNLLCDHCGEDTFIQNSVIDLQIVTKSLRKPTIDCKCGQKLSIFDGAVKYFEELDFYKLYSPFGGVKDGSEIIKVGEWKRVILDTDFDTIDEIHTNGYSMNEDISLHGMKIDTSFDRSKPNEFTIFTSSNEDELGQIANIRWVAYGQKTNLQLDIWKENCIFSARQLLLKNYRSCVIQSAISIESFIYQLVTKHLKNELKWDKKLIGDYIDGESKDSFPVQSLVRIFIQKFMKIKVGSAIVEDWKCLKKLRDSLAHGNIEKYNKISKPSGEVFIDDKERAIFSYQTMTKFIFEILYS
jgi:hypothetical protein